MCVCVCAVILFVYNMDINLSLKQVCTLCYDEKHIDDEMRRKKMLNEITGRSLYMHMVSREPYGIITFEQR